MKLYITQVFRLQWFLLKIRPLKNVECLIFLKSAFINVGPHFGELE